MTNWLEYTNHLEQKSTLVKRCIGKRTCNTCKMRLIFLGTSAAQPTLERGLSCICLEYDGEILLFDAGESAQISFIKAKLGWNKKMKILITHMHGDHCVGILGLLQTMSMQGRTERLEIYGPKGIDEFVYANIKILNFGLTFPVIINIIEDKMVIDDKYYSIKVCKASHSITAFSYRFDEREKPGRFLQQNAEQLNIPKGPLWKELQSGKSIEIDGKKITPSQVLGEKRPGVRVGISGDTRPTKELTEFFRDCNCLTFDATFGSELKDRALETRHSTAAEAGKLAQEAKVKTLVLTHFSARYTDTEPLVKEAREFCDTVIAAKDLLVVEVR